jgi:hypothetical protein
VANAAFPLAFLLAVDDWLNALAKFSMIPGLRVTVADIVLTLATALTNALVLELTAVKLALLNAVRSAPSM